MDLDGLLQSVIRFSNYMTARLIVSGAFFFVLSGFIHLGNPTEGLLPNLDLFRSIIQNYQEIFDILGVSDIALWLIFFLFLTCIHFIYLAFDRVGHYIPPAITPLPGWDAINDLTGAAFQILREARGDQHSSKENQRLYEFQRKLEALDAENEVKHEQELLAVNAVFRVSKSFVLFSGVAWILATLSGDYQGEPILLLVILGLALLMALISTLSITRAHYDRIDELRTEVTHQMKSFASIWAPVSYQKRMEIACLPSQELKPCHFEILMPVYGKVGHFLTDVKKLQTKTKSLIASLEEDRPEAEAPPPLAIVPDAPEKRKRK